MSDYGHHSETTDEYIITNPFTPAPWCNYLANENVTSHIGATSGGYLQTTDGRNILAKREGGLQADFPGRYIYIYDEVDKHLFSCGVQPVCSDYEYFETRHTPAYSRTRSQSGDISTELTVFIPPEIDGEIWTFSFSNSGNRLREITLTPYIEWGVPQNNKSWEYNINRTKTFKDEELNAIRHQSLGYTDLIAWTNFPFTEWDCSRNSFIGAGHNESAPVSIKKDSCKNTTAHGVASCAAFQATFNLKPMEQMSYQFYIGTNSDIASLIKTLSSDEKTTALFNETLNATSSTFAALNVKTPETSINKTVNIWAPHAVRINAKLENSISDALQNSQARGLYYPQQTRDLLLYITQYQHKTGRFDNSISAHIYFALAVYDYICETGDIEILLEETKWADNSTSPLLNHIHSAMNLGSEELSENGLLSIPKIDGLNFLDTLCSGGTSALRTMQFISALKKTALLSGSEGDIYKNLADDLSDVINSTAFYNGKYILGFNSDNTPIEELFLDPQSWAVLSGVAQCENAKICLDTVYEKLETPYGLSSCETPITTLAEFPAGTNQNGGISISSNSLAVLAEGAMNRAGRVIDILMRILPEETSKNIGGARFACNPYVACEYITGATHTHFGLGKNQWNTKANAYLSIAISRALFGLTPTLSGLEINPNLPKEWNDITATRNFRDGIYNIKYTNTHSNITFNNTILNSATLPLTNNSEECKVEVGIKKQ